QAHAVWNRERFEQPPLTRTWIHWPEHASLLVWGGSAADSGSVSACWPRAGLWFEKEGAEPCRGRLSASRRACRDQERELRSPRARTGPAVAAESCGAKPGNARLLPPAPRTTPFPRAAGQIWSPTKGRSRPPGRAWASRFPAG